MCCLVSSVCCLRVSASCAVLLSLCCVSRRTVSRASSLVWPALLCARPVRRVCSRVTRCALCCVYICSWTVYLPGLYLAVARRCWSPSLPDLCIFLVCISSLRLHLLLVCISYWSVSRRCWSPSLPDLYIFLICISSLRLHLFLVCISSWSVSRRCVFVSLSVWSICVFASKNVCPAGELVVLERRSSVYLSDLYLVIAS